MSAVNLLANSLARTAPVHPNQRCFAELRRDHAPAGAESGDFDPRCPLGGAGPSAAGPTSGRWRSNGTTAPVSPSGSCRWPKSLCARGRGSIATGAIAARVDSAAPADPDSDDVTAVAGRS